MISDDRYVDARLRRILLKVVDRSSALGMKIIRTTFGWTHHHHSSTCGVSFLNV
jgi:hypothetical protein